MIKNGMVTRTIEGFIRKLKEDGHARYASELRFILNMYRKRRNAEVSLSLMNIDLLGQIVKCLSIPKSKDRDKWYDDIKSHISVFNVNNHLGKNDTKQFWIPIKYIREDLNGILSCSSFVKYMKNELSGYPAKDRGEVLKLLKNHRTLRSLGIKVSYDSNGYLTINILGNSF
jgi:hypothetical protein